MKKYIFLFFILAVIRTFSISQTTNSGLPITLQEKIPLTKHFYQTPLVNNETEKFNEKIRQQSVQEKVYRFGKEFDVAIAVFDKAETAHKQIILR